MIPSIEHRLFPNQFQEEFPILADTFTSCSFIDYLFIKVVGIQYMMGTNSFKCCFMSDPKVKLPLVRLLKEEMWNHVLNEPLIH